MKKLECLGCGAGLKVNPDKPTRFLECQFCGVTNLLIGEEETKEIKRIQDGLFGNPPISFGNQEFISSADAYLSVSTVCQMVYITGSNGTLQQSFNQMNGGY